MVVVTVDDCDFTIGALEGLCGCKTSESAADDRDTWLFLLLLAHGNGTISRPAAGVSPTPTVTDTGRDAGRGTDTVLLLG